MAFITLTTFQKYRYHSSVILPPSYHPQIKYLPRFHLESSAIVSLIASEQTYFYYPEGYDFLAGNERVSPTLTTVTEITLKSVTAPYTVEEALDEILALISEAEYEDKLRWHKQAKKARDIVGR